MKNRFIVRRAVEVSTLQSTPSSQVSGGPFRQVRPLHISVPLQNNPSSQSAAVGQQFGTGTFTQESEIQELIAGRSTRT